MRIRKLLTVREYKIVMIFFSVIRELLESEYIHSLKIKHIGKIQPRLRFLREKLVDLHLKNGSDKPDEDIIELEALIHEREIYNNKKRYGDIRKEESLQKRRVLPIREL